MGNDNTAWESFKSFLKGIFCVVVLIEICACAWVGVETGIIPTSEQKPEAYPRSTFFLTVDQTGETVVSATRNVSEAVRDRVEGKVFPTPEAAAHAAAPTQEPDAVDWFGVKAAEAHAVNICTHSDGVISHNTGYGRHLTNFRFHDNGRHYTRTYHQVLNFNGWTTTDDFYYDVSRNYCNCN